MKLPPYGKSIDRSNDIIWLWAGEKSRVHQSVKTFSKNTVAFYPPQDPKEYIFFVKNRDVVLIHFFEPQNFWVKQIILSLLKASASRVAEISWPHCGAWWNPHYDLYTQFFMDVEQPITINNYSRS